MPVQIKANDILFIRHLERELEKTKKEKADELAEGTIDALYKDAGGKLAKHRKVIENALLVIPPYGAKDDLDYQRPTDIRFFQDFLTADKEALKKAWLKRESGLFAKRTDEDAEKAYDAGHRIAIEELENSKDPSVKKQSSVTYGNEKAISELEMVSRLQQVNFIEDTALELPISVYYELLQHGGFITSDAERDLKNAWIAKNSGKKERDWKEKLKEAQNVAQERIDKHISLEKKHAVEAHQLAIDRVALGLEPNQALPDNPFVKIWGTLHSELALTGSVPPKHHTEVLARIKSHFDAQKETRVVTDLEREYNEARVRYYQLLKEEHDERKAEKAEQEKPEQSLAYKLGYEKRRLKNEIASKEEDQFLVKNGLRGAKVFALAQGVFVAGGAFGLMTGWGWMVGIGAYVCYALIATMFLATTRSNWLTINKEMGPLLKELFYDPALADVHWTKRLWNMVRRVDLKDGWNTFKGTQNLVASSFIGLLTFAGGMSLFGIIPGAFPISIGVLGTASVGVVVVSAVLALVTTFVYFVINNLVQQKKNKGAHWKDKDLERHEKLRTITRASTWNFFKKYGFNIAVGLTGVTGLLLAASVDLFGMFHAFFPATVNWFSFIGPAFNAIPFGAAISTVIIFAIFAVPGFMAFYQNRTLGSTEGIIAEKAGLRQDDIRKGMDLDVTGQDQPDFGAKKGRDWGWLTNLNLFNMDPNHNNSEPARVVNALGQGLPAYAGLGSSGVTFAALAAVGAIWAPEFAGATLSLGSLGGVGLIFALSAAVGIVAIGCCAIASYSANSVGLRVVKEKVTEVIVLNNDKNVLDKVTFSDPKDQAMEELGAAEADLGLYKQSREGHGDNYWGLGYTKAEKLEAVKDLADKLKNTATGEKLNFTYRPAAEQGELGEITARVKKSIARAQA